MQGGRRIFFFVQEVGGRWPLELHPRNGGWESEEGVSGDFFCWEQEGLVMGMHSHPFAKILEGLVVSFSVMGTFPFHSNLSAPPLFPHSHPRKQTKKPKVPHSRAIAAPTQFNC